MSKVNLREQFLFEYNKIKLFLVVDMKIIIRFYLKSTFYRIKNNFKYTSPKNTFSCLNSTSSRIKRLPNILNYYVTSFSFH